MRGNARGGDLNAVVSNILKYGVIASALLVVVGIVLLFENTPSDFPSSVQQVISADYGRSTLSATTLFVGVVAINPVFLIQLGLIVLLATPIVRVGVSVLYFAHQKDVAYVAITLIVLLVVLIGIFLVGPFESPVA
jgi:uncharacterized membrane protein